MTTNDYKSRRVDVSERVEKTDDRRYLTASTVSSREVDDDCSAERPSPINLVPRRTNQCFAGRPTVTFSITSRVLCIGAFCRAILCISGTRGGSRILVGGALPEVPQRSPGAEPRWRSGAKPQEARRMLRHEAEKPTYGEKKTSPYRLTDIV